MPSIDPSQFPSLSTGIAGSGSALSGMASMAGGMSGYGTAARTAAYDSYDTTKKDAAVITADEEMTVQIQVDELDIRTLETGMEATVTLTPCPAAASPVPSLPSTPMERIPAATPSTPSPSPCPGTKKCSPA